MIFVSILNATIVAICAGIMGMGYSFCILTFGIICFLMRMFPSEIKKLNLFTLLAILLFDYLIFCHAAFRVRDFKDDSLDAQVIVRLLFSIGLLLNIFVIFVRASGYFKFSYQEYSLIVFGWFILLGTIYSVVPLYTLTSGIIYIILIISVFILNRKFGFQVVFQLISYSMISLLFLSVILSITNVDYAWSIDLIGYNSIARFKGIFIHPVQLGNALSYIILFSVYTFCFKRNVAYFEILFLVFVASLSLYFIYLAQSRIALISVIVSVAYIVKFKGGRFVSFVYGFLLLVLILIASEFSSEIVARLTRSGNVAELWTLTGRTAVWNYANSFIDARPLLGYGFGATRKLFESLPTLLGWNAAHSHNLWYQAVLETGYVGLILLCIPLSFLLRATVKFSNVIVGVIFIQIVIRSMTEVVLFFYVPGVTVVALSLAVSQCSFDFLQKKIQRK